MYLCIVCCLGVFFILVHQISYLFSEFFILPGCLALGGYDVSNDVYAWIIVCALPVNSAINPFLYTVTTTKKIEVKVDIHLLPSFEGDMKICSTQKIMSPEGLLCKALLVSSFSCTPSCQFSDIVWHDEYAHVFIELHWVRLSQVAKNEKIIGHMTKICTL